VVIRLCMQMTVSFLPFFPYVRQLTPSLPPSLPPPSSNGTTKALTLVSVLASESRSSIEGKRPSSSLLSWCKYGESRSLPPSLPALFPLAVDRGFTAFSVALVMVPKWQLEMFAPSLLPSFPPSLPFYHSFYPCFPPFACLKGISPLFFLQLLYAVFSSSPTPPLPPSLPPSLRNLLGVARTRRVSVFRQPFNKMTLYGAFGRERREGGRGGRGEGGRHASLSIICRSMGPLVGKEGREGGRGEIVKCLAFGLWLFSPAPPLPPSLPPSLPPAEVIVVLLIVFVPVVNGIFLTRPCPSSSSSSIPSSLLLTQSVLTSSSLPPSLPSAEVIVVLLIVFVPVVNGVFLTRPLPFLFFFYPFLFGVGMMFLMEAQKALRARSPLLEQLLGW